MIFSPTAPLAYPETNSTFKVGRLPERLFRQLLAVHSRHDHICEKKVQLLLILFNDPERVGTIHRFYHVVAKVAQQLAIEFAQAGVILGEQIVSPPPRIVSVLSLVTLGSAAAARGR